MALIKCKECGSEVSTTAKTCPKCGAKVKKPVGIVGVILVIAFVGYIVSTISGRESSNPTAKNSANRESPKNVAAIKHEWQYTLTDKDKMSGEIAELATLDSDTILTFEFPYNGGSKPSLTILRTKGKKNNSILLEVTKGQFLTCIPDCPVAVKFDDGKINRYSATSPHDGTSNMLFIHNENQFIEQLKHSKLLIISADFYQNPGRQMEFSTAGFKW